MDYFVHIELGKHEANTQFIYKDMAFLSNDLKFSDIGLSEKYAVLNVIEKNTRFPRTAWLVWLSFQFCFVVIGQI